ncbi:MAG: hypothetical protein EON93_04245 [Burkholderiales bacterium]|nr:MAG: hypothetical protein EON93_04245 [Burkholderiales bacterium]
MHDPAWNFESEPPFEERTEAGINLCAYFDGMADTKLKTWNASFTDEELVEWDGNFKDDGAMLLPCTESEEVEPDMYRRYITECIRYRDRVRATLMASA